MHCWVEGPMLIQRQAWECGLRLPQERMWKSWFQCHHRCRYERRSGQQCGMRHTQPGRMSRSEPWSESKRSVAGKSICHSAARQRFIIPVIQPIVSHRIHTTLFVYVSSKYAKQTVYNYAQWNLDKFLLQYIWISVSAISGNFTKAF